MGTQEAEIQSRRPRIQAPPQWGIEPVPVEHRLLGFLDYFALWSSLGVGLLVLLAGTLLVPALGMGPALLAIVVGTLIGNALLALVGLVGSRTGVPTMVLFRPSLGVRGSYLPTLLNVLQLVGWGAFEIFIMAQAAHGIARQFVGASGFLGWGLFFAALCTALAVSGPLAVVRQWIEKFAVWLVYLSTIYLTVYLFTHHDLGAIFAQPGAGGLTFWAAVDLVVAMPVSWMPLVADYNRFARDDRRAFWGTYTGYFVANVWFYALGALFVLALGTGDLIPAILSLAGGWMALLLILVDETDNAFANIYSTAVSAQNVLSRVPQWVLAVATGGVCFLVAWWISTGVPTAAYEGFLFLIGSFFVPLFGVLAADYFLLRRQYDLTEFYRARGAYWYRYGVNVPALVAWGLGFAAYRLMVARLPGVGASLPSFIVAALAHLVLTKVLESRRSAGGEERRS
ncbi:MAG: putative hydroxymethylpyrimidine transporter CytX [Bacillota bacterium]|nr:putative hydroxymethylpyrimidine transporter CytX [Bacillota bacterium]